MPEKDNYIPLSERIETARAEGIKEIIFYGIRINTDIGEAAKMLSGVLMSQTPLEAETDSIINPETQI